MGKKIGGSYRMDSEGILNHLSVMLERECGTLIWSRRFEHNRHVCFYPYCLTVLNQRHTYGMKGNLRNTHCIPRRAGTGRFQGFATQLKSNLIALDLTGH